MTELFKNVKPGQRCLFYALKPGQDLDTAIEDTVMFEADVVEIVNGRTLNANNIDCKESCVYQTRGILCMPLGWIVKLEILRDIVCEEELASSEIILEVETFY